jgi:hypothetical protein
MRVSSVLSVLVGCVALSACTHSPRAQNPMPASSVWVCHADQDQVRHWLRVSAADGDIHRGHADRVSSYRQDEGARCDNRSDAQDRRGP